MDSSQVTRKVAYQVVAYQVVVDQVVVDWALRCRSQYPGHPRHLHQVIRRQLLDRFANRSRPALVRHLRFRAVDPQRNLRCIEVARSH